MSLPFDIFPNQRSPEELKQASSLIQKIELDFDDGGNASSALVDLRQLVGNQSLKAEQYFQVSGAMSYEQAAVLAFCPPARKINDLQFEGFVQLCEKMREDIVSDEFPYWFEMFCLNAKSSNAGDLVFRPPQEWLDRLIAAGEIDSDADYQSFQPTARQLAVQAWKSDAILC